MPAAVLSVIISRQSQRVGPLSSAKIKRDRLARRRPLPIVVVNSRQVSRAQITSLARHVLRRVAVGFRRISHAKRTSRTWWWPTSRRRHVETPVRDAQSREFWHRYIFKHASTTRCRSLSLSLSGATCPSRCSRLDLRQL